MKVRAFTLFALFVFAACGGEQKLPPDPPSAEDPAPAVSPPPNEAPEQPHDREASSVHAPSRSERCGQCLSQRNGCEEHCSREPSLVHRCEGPTSDNECLEKVARERQAAFDRCKLKCGECAAPCGERKDGGASDAAN